MIQTSRLEKKAIISLKIGIIVWVLYILQRIIVRFTATPVSPPIIHPVALITFIAPVLSIIGLIFGIQSLKSAKRNFAIAGVILNLIGLIIPFYYFLS